MCQHGMNSDMNVINKRAVLKEQARLISFKLTKSNGFYSHVYYFSLLSDLSFLNLVKKE